MNASGFKAIAVVAAGVLSSASPAATFNVAPGDTGGLAAAIVSANANADCINRIVLPVGTWTFAAPWSGSDSEPNTALPGVRLFNGNCDKRALMIEGAGADRTILQRAPSSLRMRFLSVSPGGFGFGHGLTLSGLTLRGGDLFPASPAEFFGNGGAVLVDSSALTLDRVVLRGNRATQGGAVQVDMGNLFVRDSVIEGNAAARQGGAVYGSGSLMVERSSISANTAGALFVGDASEQGGGALLWVPHAESAIVDSTVANNQTLHNARQGGGLYLPNAGAPPFHVLRSELRGNRAGGSGGAVASTGPVLMDSSTASGNSSAARGAAFFSGEVQLFHATVATNVAAAGESAVVAGTLRAWNSLVAATRNPSGAAAANCSADTLADSQGHNLDSDGSCRLSGPGDVAVFDPAAVIELVPRNNGGRTLTHALLPGGAAVDAADPQACRSSADQRGAPGRQDGNGDGVVRCDIGAFEYQPALLTLLAAADSHVRTDLDIRRNDNHGLQDYLELGTGRGGAGQAFGAPDQMRAMLRFDLPGLTGLRLTGAAFEAFLHSFDGTGIGLFSPEVHAITAPWVEGNGFEGVRPSGAPANLTDTDSASGVAWAGAGANSDPFAANNTTQPAFDASPLSATLVAREASVYPVTALGSVLRWDVTAAATRWLNGTLANNGVMLIDPVTDGAFRGLRLGSREGASYRLPGFVPAPRLSLAWTMGVRPGDVTGDGCVDRRDLELLMVVSRGQAVAGPLLAPKLDLNGDGRIDVADARKLATIFTLPLGVPCP